MKVFPLSCTLQIAVRCLSRDGKNETSHKTYRTRGLERLWKCHAYDIDWGSRRKTMKKRWEGKKSEVVQLPLPRCRAYNKSLSFFCCCSAKVDMTSHLLCWMNESAWNWLPNDDLKSWKFFFLVIFCLAIFAHTPKIPPIQTQFQRARREFTKNHFRRP